MDTSKLRREQLWEWPEHKQDRSFVIKDVKKIHNEQVGEEMGSSQDSRPQCAEPLNGRHITKSEFPL